jgi:hypothetical protein
LPGNGLEQQSRPCLGDPRVAPSPGAARAAPRHSDHRPPSTYSPSLAVAGGLRRAKPGRSGGGRALTLLVRGGSAGELGISSAAAGATAPSSAGGALRPAGSGRCGVEGAMGAVAGGLELSRAGQMWVIGLDLGLAGPSRRLRRATPGVQRALLTSWRVSAWLPSRRARGGAPDCVWQVLAGLHLWRRVPAGEEDVGAAAPGRGRRHPGSLQMCGCVLRSMRCCSWRCFVVFGGRQWSLAAQLALLCGHGHYVV